MEIFFFFLSEGRREKIRGRASALLRLVLPSPPHRAALQQVFLFFRLFPDFFQNFSPPALVLCFLMNWSSLRGEGLLVPLEGEGGELVPFSSLQECELWFENGEPGHTLLRWFHSSVCAPPHATQPSFTCCSTFAQPESVCRLYLTAAASVLTSCSSVQDTAGGKGGSKKSHLSP